MNEKNLCRIYITKEAGVKADIPKLTPGELLELNFHLDQTKKAVLKKLEKYKDFSFGD